VAPFARRGWTTLAIARRLGLTEEYVAHVRARLGPRRRRDWTAGEDALFATLAAAEVAAGVGRTAGAARRRLGALRRRAGTS
jgi:hypothetical protein